MPLFRIDVLNSPVEYVEADDFTEAIQIWKEQGSSAKEYGSGVEHHILAVEHLTHTVLRKRSDNE